MPWFRPAGIWFFETSATVMLITFQIYKTCVRLPLERPKTLDCENHWPLFNVSTFGDILHYTVYSSCSLQPFPALKKQHNFGRLTFFQTGNHIIFSSPAMAAIGILSAIARASATLDGTTTRVELRIRCRGLPGFV